jgi:hypothetical protein
MDISFYMKLLKTLGAWYQQFVEKNRWNLYTIVGLENQNMENIVN